LEEWAIRPICSSLILRQWDVSYIMQSERVTNFQSFAMLCPFLQLCSNRRGLITDIQLCPYLSSNELGISYSTLDVLWMENPVIRYWSPIASLNLNQALTRKNQQLVSKLVDCVLPRQWPPWSTPGKVVLVISVLSITKSAGTRWKIDRAHTSFQFVLKLDLDYL